jgi:hypothetical protein
MTTLPGHLFPGPGDSCDDFLAALSIFEDAAIDAADAAAVFRNDLRESFIK